MIDLHTYRNVLAEQEGSVSIITMNRPERRNALSLEHMTELIQCFTGIGDRGDVAVVILRGSGPAFCAGHDLGEMIGREPRFYRRLFDVCTELMEIIQAIPQPVIAQVQGIATAAGCQLVATCDLAVAATTARFATPGVKIGLFCSTPMVALSRAVGRKKAMEMLLTGEPISAQEALAAGLVNRLAPPEDLAATTMALAERIAGSSQFVVGIGKQAFYQQIDIPQQQAYGFAREVMSANALAADAQEGMSAFLEKREPHWVDG
ncbi:MAG TPA: enoyl-CoA hydratase [Chloroflexota bacterium]|nr:enoyl-CoA hydratase [Chloroflexota bacterium]